MGNLTENMVYIESWVEESGTFGLEYLFIEADEREDMEVQDLVVNLTKNKLFDIFLKTCPDPRKKYRSYHMCNKASPGVLVTPGKRKNSSLPDLENTRPTKTACHRQRGSRSRAHTVGGSPNLKNLMQERQRTRSNSSAGQQVLTRWYAKSSHKLKSSQE